MRRTDFWPSAMALAFVPSSPARHVGKAGRTRSDLRGAALGVLRTREMEESARVLDADVVWLGRGPDDPVHDFGFSRTATILSPGGERIVLSSG